MDKQPIKSGFNFTPLDDLIREEELENIQTEPSVIDSEAPEDTPPAEPKEDDKKKKEENLPPSVASKFKSLSELADDGEEVVGGDDDSTTVPETTTDEDDEGGSVVDDKSKEDTLNNDAPVSLEDTFNFFTESGLLAVPEGFEFDGSEEKFNEALQYHQQYQQQAAMQNIKNQIQDPRVYELIKHGIEGGKFSDLNKMFDSVSTQINLDGLDPEKETDAENLMRKYYKDVAKFTKEQSDRYISTLKEQETLTSEAKLAKTYLSEQAASEKERFDKETAQKRAMSQQAFNNRIQGVSKAIQTEGYQGEVVKGITNMLNGVVGQDNQQIYKEDGTPMLWYEAQVEMLADKPEHLAQFLAFMQGYTPENGFAEFSKQKQKTEKSKKNKSSFELFNKMKRTKGGSAGGSQEGGGKKPFVPTPPDSYDE